MKYITHKRFRGLGIEGRFNLPWGTACEERDGYIFAPDGRCVCAVTSENGWEHFRPDTVDGAYRQKLLDRLYAYYTPKDERTPPEGDPADFAAEKWPGADNLYWKNLLRTMPTDKLTEIYTERLGAPD